MMLPQEASQLPFALQHYPWEAKAWVIVIILDDLKQFQGTLLAFISKHNMHKPFQQGHLAKKSPQKRPQDSHLPGTSLKTHNLSHLLTNKSAPKVLQQADVLIYMGCTQVHTNCVNKKLLLNSTLTLRDSRNTHAALKPSG